MNQSHWHISKPFTCTQFRLEFSMLKIVQSENCRQTEYSIWVSMAPKPCVSSSQPNLIIFISNSYVDRSGFDNVYWNHVRASVGESIHHRQPTNRMQDEIQTTENQFRMHLCTHKWQSRGVENIALLSMDYKDNTQCRQYVICWYRWACSIFINYSPHIELHWIRHYTNRNSTSDSVSVETLVFNESVFDGRICCIHNSICGLNVEAICLTSTGIVSLICRIFEYDNFDEWFVKAEWS